MNYESPEYVEPISPIGTVAELFAGVGGFRIGLAKSGWKTVFSNQWEPSTKVQHASDVYVARFGPEGHSNIDIEKLNRIPGRIDLLVGGFPCQDYSVAKSLNSAKGLQGKKGVLWWEILRLVTINKPKYIFLENVDRLLKSPSTQRGRDFAIMLRTLGDKGYLIEWRVINAADYGFPQRRIRVFIVAYKSNRKSFSKNPIDVVLRDGILARALRVEESVNSSAEVDLNLSPAQITSKFNKSAGKSPFLNSGFFANDTAYTFAINPIKSENPLTLADVIVDDSEVPSHFWINKNRLPEWEYLKGAKNIKRTHKASGAIYSYAEGKMAFPDLLTNPSRTILTGEGGSTPSRFKHIIKTGRRYRRLTPVELERLNGFPDNWTLTGSNEKEMSEARRAFFMGNALVVGLIDMVGQVLASEIKNG